MLSLMLVVTFLVSVGAGILSFLNFMGSSLPFPGLLSTMMGMMALLLILWFGPLVLFPRGVGWFMRFVIGQCCLIHLLSGILIGSMCFLLLSVLMMLHEWERDSSGAGSAPRPRKRRLRSWWRPEQQSVWMVLTAAPTTASTRWRLTRRTNAYEHRRRSGRVGRGWAC